MKPTLNAISPEGVKVVSFSIDTCGFFARSLEDLQLVANVFALPMDGELSDRGLEGAKIAFVKTPMWSKAGPGTIAAMDKAATILSAHGAVVHRADLPAEMGDAQSIKKVQKTILHSEARHAFLPEYRMDKEKLHAKIRGFVENAASFSSREIVDATDRYAETRRIFDSFARQFDAVITASASDVAPLGLDDMGDSGLNFIWTVSNPSLMLRDLQDLYLQGLHAPVVHIPAFKGSDGMPVGLSVVSSRFRDQNLLRIAQVLDGPLMSEGGWKIIPKSALAGT